MKTFAVYPQAAQPTIQVRTDDNFQTFVFKHKRAADKKILALIQDGYKLDATHATMRLSHK